MFVGEIEVEIIPPKALNMDVVKKIVKEMLDTQKQETKSQQPKGKTKGKLTKFGDLTNG